jgi:hypothetical protein
MENNFDDEFNHIEESNRDGSSPSAKLREDLKAQT